MQSPNEPGQSPHGRHDGRPPVRRPRAGGGPRSRTNTDVREANLALVLDEVLRRPEGVSRADVAQSTGLTRATVSRLVEELLTSGVLVERDRVASKPGRPVTPLVATDAWCALGLQVNATFIAVRLVGLDGQTIAENVRPADLAGSDPTETLRGLADVADQLLTEHLADRRLVGAGLALPGVVTRDGLLVRAPNLDWSDVRPADLLHVEVAEAGLVVANEADLSAISLAYAAPARPREEQTFVYLSGEVGIGGSAVVGGEPMSGVHGWAGEIGHICVDPRGPRCACGSRGCLERFAGWGALAAGAGLGAGAQPSDLRAAVVEGRPAATHALSAAIDALETALVTAVNLLDIPTVILGGHLGELGDLIIPALEEGLSRRVLARRAEVVTVKSDPRLEEGLLAPAATGAAFAILTRAAADPHFLVPGSSPAAIRMTS